MHSGRRYIVQRSTKPQAAVRSKPVVDITRTTRATSLGRHDPALVAPAPALFGSGRVSAAA